MVVLALAGCGWSPRGPIDLQRVETRAVHFGLKSPRSAICPGEPVGLQVFLDVADPGSRGPSRRLVPERFDLDDAIFDLRQLHLSSPNGTFDREGTFHPSDDVTATAQSGFVMYARAPHGPAFSVRFPPSYECQRRIGRPGENGLAGSPGDDALYGDGDESRATKKARAARAASGRIGGAGGPGGTGPTMTVYVTWVRTTDYTRLLAARATGDDNRITLAAPGTPIEVLARGGEGGSGGRGGTGATAASDWEHGGPGGQGGEGGEGGNGGSVDVILDERFDDLATAVSVDASGGQGGAGGGPGQGGRSIAGEYAARHGTGYAERDGVVAPGGAPGRQGRPGGDGLVSVRRGQVAFRFQNLGAIVPL